MSEEQSMSEEAVPLSRFKMWRTIIALAHADHKVTPEERELVDSYIDSVPFSEEQRATLHEDLLDPQDIAEMFDKVLEPEDRAEFFEFARIMVWADGDLDRQEDIIMQDLKTTQMEQVDHDGLAAMVRDTREAFSIERLQQDEDFKREAKNLVGMGRILDAIRKGVRLSGV